MSVAIDLNQEPDRLLGQLRCCVAWFFAGYVLQHGKPLFQVPTHRLRDGTNVRVREECIKSALCLESISRIIGMLKILFNQKLTLGGLREQNTIVAGGAERPEMNVVAEPGTLKRCQYLFLTHSPRLSLISVHDLITARPGLARTAPAGSKRIRSSLGGRSGSVKNSGRSSMKWVQRASQTHATFSARVSRK